jgi:predicted DNA-binding transcriptional regulator AlpA
MDETHSMMLTAKQVAQVLNISERSVWRMKSAGLLPRCVVLGGMVRWVRSELLKWIDKGCPGLSRK